MKIAVIDGQGGGVGKALISSLRERYGNKITILALGTNALATSAMIKTGADEGATGENAILFMTGHVDLIMGPIGIIMANSMLGELTPAMSEAIGSSHCSKILIPIKKCQIIIPGSGYKSIQTLIEEAVDSVADILSTKDN